MFARFDCRLCDILALIFKIKRYASLASLCIVNQMKNNGTCERHSNYKKTKNSACTLFTLMFRTWCAGVAGINVMPLSLQPERKSRLLFLSSKSPTPPESLHCMTARAPVVWARDCVTVSITIDTKARLLTANHFFPNE